ncbi:MAG: cold-shock protein [Candidatus Methylacidiphilales bacterium]|nr:cold shock domain-containing protein [Candidatus Methylacidiphilales bacterium]
MAEGFIKWFDNKKGWGFIAQQDGGADVFVHFSSIKGEGFKTLDEGDKVKYDAFESGKGLKAVDVERLETASEKQ